MRTAKALMAMVALAAVIGWSSTAMAVTFDLDVNVGWINSTGTCLDPPSDCLGFAGIGGFGAGSSTRLNWDNATGLPNTTGDSYLGIGALPTFVAFPANSPVGVGSIPAGTGTGTITDDGSIVRTAQIRHTNNAIPDEDDDLATIQLNTQLVLSSGATVILDLPFNPLVTFLEIANIAGDAQFTFNENLGTIDVPFSFGGDDFILHIRGLVNADNSFACEPGAGTTLNCLTAEDQVNDRFVIASLQNVTQVPAPAALLLVGMGLVVLAARRRLRRS